jgi:hypothetical protein
MYGCEGLSEMKADIESILSVSEEITQDKLKCGLFTRFVRSVVRIFAPLL